MTETTPLIVEARSDDYRPGPSLGSGDAWKRELSAGGARLKDLIEGLEGVVSAVEKCGVVKLGELHVEVTVPMFCLLPAGTNNVATAYVSNANPRLAPSSHTVQTYHLVT